MRAHSRVVEPANAAASARASARRAPDTRGARWSSTDTAQRKLTVGPANDSWEREADETADRIMATARGRVLDGAGAFAAAGVHRGSSGMLQRACAECSKREEDDRRGHGRRRGDEDETIFGKLTGQRSETNSVDEAELRGLGAGVPLAVDERGFFESHFGHDFAGVRVHTGPKAERVAEHIGARAFTYRNNVVFGAGQYAPETAVGQHLMAHELTHVVQQGYGVTSTVQRELATPEPAVAPAEQDQLTPAQIRQAINFNRARFDGDSTRTIQDLIGTEQTGTWSEADILAVAVIQQNYGLTADGRVGAETFRFLDRELTNASASTDDENCLTSLSINLDAQNVAQVGTDLAMTRHFTMRAQFPSHCAGCSHFQYRQFIRGHLTRTRAGVTSDLGAVFSDLPARRINAAFQEDGALSQPSVNFGHRNRGAEADNRYVNDAGAVDMANGCRYHGDDTPGGRLLGNVVGDVVDLRVAFRGEIRRNGTVVQTQFWTGPQTRTVIV